jgi:hypothetical protein
LVATLAEVTTIGRRKKKGKRERWKVRRKEEKDGGRREQGGENMEKGAGSR